jgi:hypothetical protein
MTDMGREPDFPGREADFRFPQSKPTFKLRHYQPFAKSTAELPVSPSNSAAREADCWLVHATPSADQT